MLPTDIAMTEHEKAEAEDEDGSDFTLLREREISPLQRQSSDCLEYYRSHEWLRFPRHVEPLVLAAARWSAVLLTDIEVAQSEGRIFS